MKSSKMELAIKIIKLSQQVRQWKMCGEREREKERERERKREKERERERFMAFLRNPRRFKMR